MALHKTPSTALISDEALVAQAKASQPGALDALIAKHQATVRVLASGFRAAGLEREDFTQEALVGLIKAVRSFDASRGVPFAPYASLCMRRQLLSTVKNAGACKHEPLSNYISLDDACELPLYQLHAMTAESPESIVILDEEAIVRTQKIHSLLSTFEQAALSLYLSGLSHTEMSVRLKSTQKSVDNALQRVRRKLRAMKL